MREVAFPGVKDFTELFTSKAYKGPPRTVAEFEGAFDKGEMVEIRNYCRCSDHRTLDVTPSPAVLEYLKSTLCVPGDVTFDVVIRGKTALVTARYSQIIGSRWIADVDLETIPKFED